MNSNGQNWPASIRPSKSVVMLATLRAMFFGKSSDRHHFLTLMLDLENVVTLCPVNLGTQAFCRDSKVPATKSAEATQMQKGILKTAGQWLAEQAARAIFRELARMAIRYVLRALLGSDE